MLLTRIRMSRDAMPATSSRQKSTIEQNESIVSSSVGTSSMTKNSNSKEKEEPGATFGAGEDNKSKRKPATSWFGGMLAEEATAAEAEARSHNSCRHHRHHQQSRVAGLRTIVLENEGDESHQDDKDYSDASRKQENTLEAGQPSGELSKAKVKSSPRNEARSSNIDDQSTTRKGDKGGGKRGGGLDRKAPGLHRTMCKFAEELASSPGKDGRRSNITPSSSHPIDGDSETRTSILEAWKQLEDEEENSNDQQESDANDDSDGDNRKTDCSSSLRDAKLIRRTGSKKRVSTSSSGDGSLVRKLSMDIAAGLDKLADEVLPPQDEAGSQTSSTTSSNLGRMGSVSIQQELEAARAALEKLKSERDEERALLRSKHEILQRELHVTKEELNITKERSAQKHSAESMHHLEEEVDDLEEECRAQAKMKELVEQKNKILEDTLEVQSGELAKCLADLACRDDELKDLREDMKHMNQFASEAELDDMRRRYRVLEEENGSLQEEMETMAMKTEKNEKDLSKARHDLAEKDEELKSLRDGANRSTIEVRELRARITELQLEKVALADEVEELGEQLEESFQLFAVKAAECNTLTNKLEIILDDQDECDNELNDIQKELVVEKGRVKLLERENRALKKKAAGNFRAAPLAVGDNNNNNDDSFDKDDAAEEFEDILDTTDRNAGGQQKRRGSFGALQNLTELFAKSNEPTRGVENSTIAGGEDDTKDEEIRNLKRELERQKAMYQIESSRSRRTIEQLTYQVEDMTDRLVDKKGQKAAAAASARLLKKTETFDNGNSFGDTGSTESFTAIMNEAAKISDLSSGPKEPGARTA